MIYKKKGDSAIKPKLTSVKQNLPLISEINLTTLRHTNNTDISVFFSFKEILKNKIQFITCVL